MRLVLPLVLLVAQVLPPPAPAGPTPFMLGVLRRDGLVSPFAAFDGKRWDAPWPGNLRTLEVPISLDTVPGRWWGKPGPAMEMSIWADGSRQGSLRLERPTVLPIMCETRLALTSTYRSKEAAPPLVTQPYPKDGLAISGSQTVDAIESVPPTDPQWAATIFRLMDPVDRAELDAVNAFTDWKHPIARKERLKVPVELEMLYRAPMDEAGWTAYYVEAVKRYPPGPGDDDCGLITSISGWITTGPERKSRVLVGARVTYCDRRGAAFVLPLGLIKTGGRTYWIYQGSGYGLETYIVARPTPREIEPHVFYSACFCGRD